MGKKSASARSAPQIATATTSHASIESDLDSDRTVSDENGSESENDATECRRKAASASCGDELSGVARNLRSKRARPAQSSPKPPQKWSKESASGIAGVYEKEGAMEAQLDVNRLKGIIDPQRATDMIRLDNGDRKVKPEAIYIGLCYFDASEPQSRELAVQLCDRANTRAALKLFELLGVDPASFKDGLMKIFPQVEPLISGPDAEDRKQFKTFDIYRQELKRELQASSGRLKGIYPKQTKGGVVFETRYSKVAGLRSFGRYDTQAEATAAFDLGTILAFGPGEKPMNASITKYMIDGKFREHVRIPTKVIESIQSYLIAKQDSKILERIRSYFPDTIPCPFYDPPASSD